MRRNTRWARQVVAFAGVVSVIAAARVASCADDEPSLRVPGPSPAEQRLEAALAAEADLDFVELPVVDLVDYLRERLPGPVQLDSAALADQGYDPQRLTVTGTFSGTPLRSALWALLLPLELDFTIAHDTLWITTRRAAEYRLLTRCYDVGELLVAWSTSFSSPAASSGNRRRTSRNRQDMAYSHCEIPDGSPATPEEALSSLVTSIVEPDSWDENGGEGALAYCPPSRALVVSQSYRVHCQVESLLMQLTARIPHDGQAVASLARPAPARNSLLKESPCWQQLLDWLTR